MAEHDTPLWGQPESIEVSFPLPVGHEDEAGYCFDKLLVSAPLNPLLVHVVVHPNNARSVVRSGIPGMIHLKVDPIKLFTQALA